MRCRTTAEEVGQGPEAVQEGGQAASLGAPWRAGTGSAAGQTADVGHVQFIINAQQPASDKIFDVSAFEKFLQERIKVEGRTNNLGDNVVIQQAGEGKIEIIANNELSGRYLKYLYVARSQPLPGGYAVPA